MSKLLSEAEIHRFGVEIIATQLQKEEYEVLSVEVNLGRNPQIVAKKEGKLAFIAVRTAAYPHKGQLEDHEMEYRLIAHADEHRATCYFASVGLANSEGKNDEEMSRLVRGGGVYVSYEGLLILTLSNRVSVLEDSAMSSAAARKQSPLTELEQKFVFRGLAVVGSGTYALKGTQTQQLEVLRSILRQAQAEGLDWKRVYAPIYDVRRLHQDSLSSGFLALPTIDEMEDQI